MEKRKAREENPAVTEATQKYADLAGYHADEWDRFLVTSYSFHDAAELAANLGWWLHCWTWEQKETSEIIITDSTPETASTPLV